ncbi:uncharacterized protein LOC144377423 isoform X4 [Ictidomys tridecemlineatus]
MSGPRKRNRNPEKHSGYQRTVPAPDFPESCSQCKQQLLPCVPTKVQRAAAAGTPGLSRSPSNSASSSIAVTGRV